MIRPITAERPLKILGFTDMHLDGNAACARWTLRLMEETVAAEAPDCVMPVHCTGIKAICDLRSMLGDACIVATAGDSYGGC